MSPAPIDPLLTPRAEIDEVRDAGENDEIEAGGDGVTVVRLVESFESAYARMYPQLVRRARSGGGWR